MNEDNKELIQDVINRLLYSGEDYKKELIFLNSHYDPHAKTKFTTDASEFMFTLDKAIN